jgi:hypothetical protein
LQTVDWLKGKLAQEGIQFRSLGGSMSMTQRAKVRLRMQMWAHQWEQIMRVHLFAYCRGRGG